MEGQKALTQHQIVMLYCRDNGEILPAKISGVVYRDTMFGSETTKRCRELRDPNSPANKYGVKVLESRKDGKFTLFFLTNIGKKIVSKYQEFDFADYVNNLIG